jgi:hypothetical protein
MSRDGPSSNNILNKPEHILSFIKHALQNDATLQDSTLKRTSQKPGTRQGLTMDDLRIVPQDKQDDDMGTGGDSDDETPESEQAQPNDEMTITALDLLLSLLEGISFCFTANLSRHSLFPSANPNLSAYSAPALEGILRDLERIDKTSSESVRALTREARMVLTVCFASASTGPSGPTREPEEDRIRSMYQRALKLLQDALLPVRAHGLLLLRELVSTRAGTAPHEAVRALEPAIRDVFLQAVQDDDSYIYLNAVQGLAALTDSFGADVLRALVRVYADGLQGVGAGTLTQQEVDVRLRVGEALGQVIRRCGDVLPRYGQFNSTSVFQRCLLT